MSGGSFFVFVVEQDARVEIDLLQDAILELNRIHRALPSRHGERFRALDRKIEELIKQTDPASGIRVPKVIRWLDADHGVLLVPSFLTAILDEAKALGV